MLTTSNLLNQMSNNVVCGLLKKNLPWILMYFVNSSIVNSGNTVCVVSVYILFYFLFLVTVNAMERTEIKINIISEQLGLSWAGKQSKNNTRNHVCH